MRFLKHWLLTLGVVALFCAIPVGLVFLLLWRAWAGITAFTLLFITLTAVASYNDDGGPCGW